MPQGSMNQSGADPEKTSAKTTERIPKARSLIYLELLSLFNSNPQHRFLEWRAQAESQTVYRSLYHRIWGAPSDYNLAYPFCIPNPFIL